MAFSSARTQCRFLLLSIIFALLVFQVYADKEPHEDSKEDNSVKKNNFCIMLSLL